MTGTRSSLALLALAQVLLACSFIPTRSDAQSAGPLQDGVRVRVWLPESYRQEQGPWRRQQLRGVLASATSDTLRVSVPGTEGTLAIARGSVMRLDVSRGRPSRPASAIERALAGAVVGAITAALNNDPSGERWPNYSRDWRAAEEGAKWGAALGAVVGFTFPTERWRRVRLN